MQSYSSAEFPRPGGLLLPAQSFVPVVGGAFDPSSLSPYVWLRFQDLSNLFKDSGGTTPVASDGDPIGLVKDRSGNARDFSQATSGNRPTYKASILNSLAVARFAATNAPSFNYFNGADLSALTAGEVFIVISLSVDPPQDSDLRTGLWYMSGDSALNTHYCFNDGTIYDTFGTTSRVTTVNPTPSLAAFRLYNVVTTSSEWTNFLDGTQLFTTGSNTVGFNVSTKLGQSLHSTNYNLDGDIAEFILFSSKLGATDKSNMKTYFANRYGLTIA